MSLAADKERLKAQVKEKESQLRVTQNERDCLERDVAHYISEIKVTWTLKFDIKCKYFSHPQLWD